MFAATAVFPLIVCGAALLIDEPRVAVKDNAPTQLGAALDPLESQTCP